MRAEREIMVKFMLSTPEDRDSGQIHINEAKKRLCLPVIFAGLIGICPTAQALITNLSPIEIRPSQLRLIQTTPTEAHWMNVDQIRRLSRIQHQLNRCGGFFDITDFSLRAIPNRDPSANPDLVDLNLSARPFKQKQWVEPLLAATQPKLIEKTVAHLSQNYANRFYDSQSGAESAEWILDQFKLYANSRADITFEKVPHKFKQSSIIVRIAGKERPNESIILGAHQDSVNWGEDTSAIASLPAPGADDDASGVGVLLEVFRGLAQSEFRPARTIEFMAYAGEELGLLGSQAIAQRYANERKKIGAVMQFDMTGFPGSGKNTITLIKDFTYAPLTGYTARLIEHYLKIQSQEDKCGYGCSDHASWNRYAYPTVFPFEAGQNLHFPEIHSVRDTIAKLDFTFATLFAKLGLAYAVELSRD